MYTDWNEFKKLFFRIPKDRLDQVRYIALRNGKKVPSGSWKNNNMTYYDIKDKMHCGANIGVVANFGGIMMLDIDLNEKSRQNEFSEVLEHIPKTFTVRTRSGGLHHYFLNDGLYDNQVFQVGKENIGELRANWQYVVAPGSYVEPGKYTVVQNCPIVHFQGQGEIAQFFRKVKTRLYKPEMFLGAVKKRINCNIQEKMSKKTGTEERRQKILGQLRQKW